MSMGRGRGYTGRHHLRDLRPGDETEEHIAARTLAELSPRATDIKTDTNKQEKKPEMEQEKKEEQQDGPDLTLLSTEDEAALKELLFVDEQYATLLVLLERFSPGEDGILFNQKLKHFESTISSMCPDEHKLQQAFATFRAAALLDAPTARKVATVGASFTRQQRQQLLRSTLLNVVMQGTFSKIDVLERANPKFLTNAANLMGDYFAEARLCNGNKVHILAAPLVRYMRALLASDDIRAHRSLATQLMQNGRELLSVLTHELDELSICIRLRLLSPPPVNVLWLLLSADLCLNKFLPLPNILQQFYAANLELTTDESFSEVSYGSWKKSPEKEDYRASNMDLSEKLNNSLSNVSLTDDRKPKLRPILGAGAGLLRQEQGVGQDNYETWSAKTSLSKRYDLNSWRQADDENVEDEPVFNPSVLPPNMQQVTPSVPPPILPNPAPVNLPANVPQAVTVPDYPPPNINRFNNFPAQDNFVNYLQQGDGAYIQNQYPNNSNFTPQGDFNPLMTNESKPEKVCTETPKTNRNKPVENWRKEKSDLAEDPNRNRQRNWSRQRSKDNIEDDDDIDADEKYRPSSRNSRSGNRRSSVESLTVKPVPKRHVTEVPRNHKYWDHDDRCDKDYNS